MARLLRILLMLVVVALVLPPLVFALFPTAEPELPLAGRRVEVAPGVGVNLIEAGSGPPVVLVHGHPGSAYDWRSVMDALAERGHHALAYDRVGYGRSDARTVPSRVDANANELLALLAAEDLREVTLVGWSYGGGTSIAAAKKDASRLARVVLVGSVGPGVEDRPAPPEWLMELMVGPVLSWISAVPPVAARLRENMTALAFEPERVTPGYRALLDANFAAPHTLETFRNEGRDLDGRADIDPSDLQLPSW
ncbi:MAG: alpha/beta hydrolase [bacterium]|nr:alpha/beta hydrolase [bacterium]